MCNQVRVRFGEARFDNEICGICGHTFAVHKAYGCHYSYERADECNCSIGRSELEARYWAIKMKQERDEYKKQLDYTIGWINANRND